VMEDVSNKLLGQFTACLEQKVGNPSTEGGAADEPTPTLVDEPTPTTGGGAEPGPAGRMNNMRDLRPRGPDTHGDGSESDQALDLGATVLPVLAKAYWKQAVGALLVLWVLRSLLGRRQSG